MAIEIKAPAFPESVADGEVAAWHKAEGDSVARDELLVEIETYKVVMEVVAPDSGILTSIVAAEGDTIESEALLAVLKQAKLQSRRPALGQHGKALSQSPLKVAIIRWAPPLAPWSLNMALMQMR